MITQHDDIPSPATTHPHPWRRTRARAYMYTGTRIYSQPPRLSDRHNIISPSTDRISYTGISFTGALAGGLHTQYTLPPTNEHKRSLQARVSLLQNEGRTEQYAPKNLRNFSAGRPLPPPHVCTESVVGRTVSYPRLLRFLSLSSARVQPSPLFSFSGQTNCSEVSQRDVGFNERPASRDHYPNLSSTVGKNKKSLARLRLGLYVRSVDLTRPSR